MFSRLNRQRVLATAIATLLGVGTLEAGTFYWDQNGIAVGTGLTPTGNWNLLDTVWNATPAGDTTAPVVWANSGLDIAVFSAGSDATGSYAVTLNAGEAIKLSGITVEEGSVTLNAFNPTLDVLNFDASIAALNVASGASLNINAAFNGTAGLVKTGLGNATIAVAGNNFLGTVTVNSGVLELTGTGSFNASAVTLGGVAGASSTLTLGTGTILELGGTLTFSNVNNAPGGLIQGGTIHLSGARSIAVMNSSDINAADDLEIRSVVADGLVAGSSLTKGNNGGVLVLTGANTYTGDTSTGGANAGTLVVRGNSGTIASSASLNIAGGSTVTIGSNADTVAVNRLNDLGYVNLNNTGNGGANFNYYGSNVVGGHTEAIGALAFNGAHRGVVTVIPATGSEVTLNLGILERNGGAVGLIRGVGLGSAVGTANSTHIFLAGAPVLIGAGAAGTTSAGILPHLLGDITATGNGAGFLTYDPTLGLRVLNSTTEQTATYTAGQNIRQTAATTVSTNVRVNSLHLAGGNTTIDSGVVLGVESGAIIFGAAGLQLGTSANVGTVDLASANQGIIHLMSPGGTFNITLNPVITGNKGLILSASGTGTRTITMNGNNTFTGGLSIYNGTFIVGNAGALNASGVNAVTVQSGTLRLAGKSITIAGLDGGSGGTVHNNNATAATLKVNGGGTFSGILENGNAAALSLTKTGADTLSLQGANTYTGLTRVEQGVLEVGGGGNDGKLTGTTGITILQGGTLRVSNTSGNNNIANRINAAASITLAGGTLDFNNSAAAAAVYQLATGILNLQAGANTVIADQAAAGQTSTLTLANLGTRASGATLNFTGNTTNFGTTRNRVEVTGLAPGFVGGWATAGNEFVKYVADVDAVTAGDQGGLVALGAADYLTVAENDALTPCIAVPKLFMACGRAAQRIARPNRL